MGVKMNYHTHTARCGHAIGFDEEYVKGAILAGIKDLGFSDHISFKNLYFPSMRQKREELLDYVASINNLKEKYKDQINIHIGFEAEYIEEFIDDYKDLLQNQGIEYLICGQHCIIKDGNQVWYNSSYHSKDMLTKYVDAVIKAMESGIFSYIAHPDLFMNGYQIWDDFAIEQSIRIFEASLKYNIPLEVNVAGLRYAYYKHKKTPTGYTLENLYPYPEFWRLASKYNVKTIIGVDAHSKNDFLDGTTEEALEFVKKYDLKLVPKLDLLNPYNK